MKHIKVYLEAIRKGGALKAALQFENHTRIKLNSNNGFPSFKKLLGEITGTRTDFKDYICTLDA